MNFEVNIVPYILNLKNPVGTSRGIYHEHKIWYVILRSKTDNSHIGVGECAPLPDLSCDALPENEYINILKSACNYLLEHGKINYDALSEYPSILFGLETAIQHYKTKSLSFWDTSFSKGEKGIIINGLIWMGDFNSMLKQIENKLQQGFKCVKLKIGAIDFEQELKLLGYIRNRFSANEITLRVDANGAFNIDDALEKLIHLSKFDLHSIEQPITAGNWKEMTQLTERTPLPIALDEELIGVNNYNEKDSLLRTIQPQFIILKPSLHGGWRGCEEWIELANKYKIGWWITSALESNIGLNAIAQWTSKLNNKLPQGLGTGMLYDNNIDIPLVIKKDCLWFESNKYNEKSISTLLSNINV